jgi:hypothetical protein
MKTVIPTRNVRTTPWHGRKGQPIEVPEAVAEHWIASGYAKAAPASPASPKATQGKQISIKQ